MNMSKKQPEPTKAPGTGFLVLAIVASCLVAALIYIAFVLFLGYLEKDNVSDSTKTIVFILFMLSWVLGPGFIAAAVVLRMLKKKR
jgi:hypothetical protein